MKAKQRLTVRLDQVSNKDIARVGGKNASLGEMLRRLARRGIRVPGGFATTAAAYWRFLDSGGLREPIQARLQALEAGELSLQSAARGIRQCILRAPLPPDFETAIRKAYRELARSCGQNAPAVAVRSSATAEDLPEASFAGQQESYLNIRGADAVIKATRRCIASLFTDRAISYREQRGFDHMAVALSVGVQLMVRADTGAAGVMFSIDTETGFRDAVLINASFGLGEMVVQGAVEPDEYLVFKPLLGRRSLCPIIGLSVGSKTRKMVYSRSGARQPTRTVNTSAAERARQVLSADEILTLARWARTIEQHYGHPMDIEWARDGESGELYILQARPETVQSTRTADALRSYTLHSKGRQLASGHSIGAGLATGKACKLDSAADLDRFEDGAVLVTGRTDPDWVPILKRAAAVVTDQGGRTSHAAIVSRELGLPAIVGTGNATRTLENGQAVTVSCAEGERGFVYAGTADYTVTEVDLASIGATRTRVMLNLANPDAALRWWPLPSDGVGLARMEFIINNLIKIHPMALVHPERVEDADARREIARFTRGWKDKRQFFVDTLARGIARIAASQYPQPVIVRMSDFKTSEYARLLGGEAFEPKESNAMLGWRGASRYYSEEYREGFRLECLAIRKAREEIGMRNVVVMIPFCRTPREADKVLAEMRHNGLRRGRRGLEVYVMAEIPSNIILAEQFAARFDGFSIGSNDLTQLTLGVDRESGRLAELFDDQHEAVKQMIHLLILRAHACDRKVGLCGQAPSDHPEFAELLVKEGIDSISVNPDSFVRVKAHVAKAEKKT